MGWGISFRLRPGEEIFDSSMGSEKAVLRPVYSVMLTNQRVLFSFNPMSSSILGSSLWNSFEYNEISNVEVVSRIFIKYLKLTTRTREYYLNVNDPDYWVERIKNYKEDFSEKFK